jgi:hypothetical protein
MTDRPRRADGARLAGWAGLALAALSISCAGSARGGRPPGATAAPGWARADLALSVGEIGLACPPGLEEELPRLAGLVRTAARAAGRWGRLRQPLELRVLADHAALEAAVGRPEHPWLRAWSFPDLVLLQSPRSWPEPPTDAQLLQLLTHELAHAVMYQAIQRTEAAAQPLERAESGEPPLWFREGLASVTAGQGPLRPGPEWLRRWLAVLPARNPLDPSAELIRTEKEAVYGAAHRAFERLLARVGDAGVLGLLARIREGSPFAEAFAASVGTSQRAFEAALLTSGFAPEPGAEWEPALR